MPSVARPVRPRLLALGLAWAIAAVAGVGCRQANRAELGPAPEGGEAGPEDPAPAPGPPSLAERLAEPRPVPPLRKHSLRGPKPEASVFVFDPALPEPTPIDPAQAEAHGLTLIDLSDDWRPYIFWDATPGLDDASTNEYAARYLALADDRGDEDGAALGTGRHNYLELYGIPPTLRVVLEDLRFARDELPACLSARGYDPSVFERHGGSIAFSTGGAAKRLKAAKATRAALRAAAKKARLDPDDEAALAADPRTKAALERARAVALEVAVIEQAQIRLACERMYATKDGRGRSTPGEFDAATHHALAQFEKKHAIMGWGHFTADNQRALARDPLALAHDRLVRVITERAVSGAAIVEDGSAAGLPGARWRDAQGREHEPRDLVGEVARTTLRALGLDDPARAIEALESLQRLSGGQFSGLVAAIELPELPAYYGDDMRFSVEIDRGDVWYDFPWDANGKPIAQPRQRMPKLTLFTEYQGQKIPLVHWRTTIGSWRSELHKGEEYYAYKNSDVGPRVWKTIMAAPVWIPPEGTPTRGLVKRKWVGDGLKTVVNYDETGPGYMSAYGLVAAYHVRLQQGRDGNVVEIDNQIRTHGSVDYMSILRRYSHGCHRLYNMNAVRLFSFVLARRAFIREGQTKIGFARLFTHEGRQHRIALNTRGYRYELVEPIPVMVHEGRIRGTRQTPYKDYVKKPGVAYASDDELP